jgi:predicted protein tyrosine phosphatase
MPVGWRSIALGQAAAALGHDEINGGDDLLSGPLPALSRRAKPLAHVLEHVDVVLDVRGVLHRNVVTTGRHLKPEAVVCSQMSAGTG